MTGAVVALVWGGGAVGGAVTFGLVATGLSLLAARLIRRTGLEPSVDHLKVYLLGFALRILGIVMLGIAVTRDRATYPALPTALGYLGAVLPLLYLETRRRR